MDEFKQSLLLSFLTAWLEWAEADAPEDPIDNFYGFVPRYALCSNIQFYLGRLDAPDSYYGDLRGALEEALATDHGPTDFPFCDEATYDQMFFAGTHHRHEPRLIWVRKKIEEIKANG